ncbi:hypothetical protein J1N35_033599 [Gossypium stocksii]|uniref:Uncharacterized protein n=1 Tax=Gossypium stocksii TaxID=47602 RepID=A0A9D3USC8_9ROSI|nr:hypothetical protein J1N35_033599 [Gossypium stocksii]
MGGSGGSNGGWRGHSRDRFVFHSNHHLHLNHPNHRFNLPLQALEQKLINDPQYESAPSIRSVAAMVTMCSLAGDGSSGGSMGGCWGPGKPATTFVMLDSSGEVLDVLYTGSLKLQSHNVNDQQRKKNDQ